MAWSGKSAEGLSARGNAYLMKGQIDRAIADYDEAIRLNPRFTQAIKSRAETIARKNELGAETNADTLIASGRTYASKGQHDRAIADYDEAIRLNPRFSQAIKSRAETVARKNELGTETLIASGRAYASKGQYDRAIAAYDEAIRLNPRFTQAIKSRVETFFAWLVVQSRGELDGGPVHDSQVVEEIMNTPRPPLAITADKAYDSEKVRQQIRDEGALPVIPNRSNATRKAYCPKRFYRRRHKIENFFCRIKDWRRIATRYDKLARNFLAATTLVGALYWIKL